MAMLVRQPPPNPMMTEALRTLSSANGLAQILQRAGVVFVFAILDGNDSSIKCLLPNRLQDFLPIEIPQ